MPLRPIGNGSGEKLASLGATFRPSRRGPEDSLIDWFIEEMPFRTRRGCSVEIFREPRLEIGFPDLVIVYWNEKIANSWEVSRKNLTLADIRLTHYLHSCGPSSQSELVRLFSSKVAHSLDRLGEAKIVRRRGSMWVARPLSDIFAVRHIIAVEAKLTAWSSAFKQAFRNTWFASASQLLVPKMPQNEFLLREAKIHKIGIWSKDGRTLNTNSLAPGGLPKSYASWLFNEWVWRANYL